MLDEVGRRVEHAGNEHLARWQLHTLEQSPLVRVPRVRRLHREAARPRRKQHVDDVAERHVVMMRPLVVPPAHVQPRSLRRHVRQRVIERLDVQARHLAELVEAQVGELDVPAHPEVGTVDLQVDAGAGDRLVLPLHGVGDGEQVLLVARVVVVAEEERDDARRGGRHERVLGPRRTARRQQIGHVGLGRARVAHADRPVARRRAAPGAAGIAEDPLGHLREIHEVSILERMASAAEPFRRSLTYVA